MTPQELRTSVLQLAFQGKLVPQSSEDGNASELLHSINRIKADKKKGTIITDINEDELPFEIPESWTWVHLNQIASTSLGKTLDKEKNTGTMRPYLCSINVYWNGIDLSKVKEARFEDAEAEKYLLRKGDLLICEGGEVGRSAIWHSDTEMYYQNALHRVRFYCDIIPEFYKYLLECYKGMGIIDRYSKGVTIKHLVQNALYAMWLPLPPLAEQKRIVAKIEELLPYIDRYEQAWSKLEEFNKRFPVDMQKSILQMAIQGKLVEQRPEEGTGEELYQQIQAEKKRLIKAGEIKKEKPLPEIAEEEIPFEIPESWKWYRIGELFSIVNGFTPLKSNLEFWTDGDIPWFTIEDVHRQGRFINSTEKYITRKALSKNTERIVPADTVLLCCTASVGEYAFTRIPLTTNQQFNAFVVKEYCKKAVYPLYVFEYAKTLKGALIDRAGKTTFNFISVGKLSNMLIPLPPLAEQKRIVAKLEEILPLCERLK